MQYPVVYEESMNTVRFGVVVSLISGKPYGAIVKTLEMDTVHTTKVASMLPGVKWFACRL